MAIDEDKLNDLLGRFVADLGATAHARNVVIGDRLGLYRGLAVVGPADAATLAEHTGTGERYVAEWLRGQAAGGYVSTDETATRYWLTEEQRRAIVEPGGGGLARKAIAEAGLGARVSLDVASAADFPGTGYDLVTTFDCLHDMGDPVAAARHIREALAADGTWLVVEPYAADEPAGNLNPVGRV